MRASRLPLLLGISVCACQCSGPKEAVLPLENVRLYETGIAYFERTGTIEDSGEIVLPVPASHLDDALKTLVVLGSDKKPIVRAVEFSTSVSDGMARSLAGLPSASDSIQLRELLASLKGDEVEVSLARERLSGRIIEVLDRAPTSEDSPDEEGSNGSARPLGLSLLFLTDKSEIRVIDGGQIEAARPKDPARLARLRTAVDALTAKARAQRLMHVVAESTGPVTLGYVAETPLWRSTYRLVIDKGGKQAVLQAWALIHNDTEENWSDVRVTLVSGKPTSFLFPLAVPRYGRRELAHPEEELSTVPQLLGTTADALWGDFDEDSGRGISGTGSGGGGSSETVGIGGVGTRGRGGGIGSYEGREMASDVLEVGNLAEIAQAKGTESGALFAYTLPSGLDLSSHSSALIPFLQKPIEVELLAWFDGPGGTARSGARIVNSTGQTLPAGPIAAFADGGLAGEAALERLKPSQRQILQYGIDLDVALDVKEGSTRSREDTRRLTFSDDKLQEHYLRTTESVYVLENRSGQPRTVYVALPVVDNAKVTGADRLEYDERSKKPVAVFVVESKKKIERALKLEEGLSRPTALATLTSERLTKFSANTAIPEADRAVAAEAVAAQKKADETGKTSAKVKADIAKAEKDIQRLRGHLEAAGAKGDTSLAGNPFVQRILSAEDRLEGLRKQAEELAAAAEVQQDMVRGALEKLSD